MKYPRYHPSGPLIVVSLDTLGNRPLRMFFWPTSYTLNPKPYGEATGRCTETPKYCELQDAARVAPSVISFSSLADALGFFYLRVPLRISLVFLSLGFLGLGFRGFIKAKASFRGPLKGL